MEGVKIIHEDYEDEAVVSFLDYLYNELSSDLQSMPYSRKDIYSKFYGDLKAFRNGEW